jgi:hypothetical protein
MLLKIINSNFMFCRFGASLDASPAKRHGEVESFQALARDRADGQRLLPLSDGFGVDAEAGEYNFVLWAA